MSSPLVALGLVLAVIAVPLEGKWELRKNVYVVDMDMRHGVTEELECEAGDAVEGVKWQKGSERLGHGKKLSVTIKEFVYGGNYTCHDSDGRLVGYNFLYINELFNHRGHPGGLLKQRQGSRKFIDCEAKNYNGSFHCSWDLKAQGNHQFMFRAQHGSDSETMPIKCTDPKAANKGLTYTITCHHSDLCPYGEEHTQVKVFLNATHENKFSNYSDTVTIRDIVRPDPPENLRVQQSLLTWTYPASWGSCTTFFPLQFNVSVTEAEKAGKKKSEHKSATNQTWQLVNGNTSLQMNTDVQHFCIQAKDQFHPSLWSNLSCSSKSEAENIPKGRVKKKKGKKHVNPGS